MDAGTLRFLLTVLGVGVVGILAALAWARMRDRARAEALLAPPDRTIPGLDTAAAAPAYVPAAEALVPASGLPSTELEPAERARVLTTTDRTGPLLRRGWADDRFVTDRTSRLAVLPDAVVAVLPEGAGSVRELLPVLQRARGRRLVLVAGSLPPEVVATLAANEAQQLLSVCPVLCDDAGDLTAVATAVGAVPLGRGELQSGWVRGLGSAGCWVSSADASWCLDAADEAGQVSTSTSG